MVAPTIGNYYQGPMYGTGYGYDTNNVSSTVSSMGNNCSIFNGCNDGADDGCISFGEGVKELGTGLLNFASSLLKPSSLLKMAAGATALVGLSLIPGVGPFIASAALWGGVGMVCCGVAENLKTALTAKTDAEQRIAWQGFGQNLLEGVLTFFGAKSIKAIAAKAPIKTNLKTGAQELTTTTENLATANQPNFIGRIFGWGRDVLKRGKNSADEVGVQQKTTVLDNVDVMDGWLTNAKEVMPKMNLLSRGEACALPASVVVELCPSEEIIRNKNFINGRRLMENNKMQTLAYGSSGLLGNPYMSNYQSPFFS